MKDFTLMESKADFSIHLDGDNSIDALVLSDMIGKMANLANLVSNESMPDCSYQIKVSAFEPGSFQINFSTLVAITTILQYNFPQWASATPDVFPNLASAASDIISVIRGFFDLAKSLKGKKPEKKHDNEDGSITIDTPDGAHITVPKGSVNIFYSNVTNHYVSEFAQNAMKRGGGFTLTQGDQSTHYSPEDIKSMAIPLPIEKMTTETQHEFRERLFIKTAVFIGRQQWEFYLRGRKIFASIQDQDFLNAVQQGVIIKRGDFIDATVLMTVEVDEQGQYLEDKAKYVVIKVHGSIQHDNLGYEQIHF